MSVGNALGRVVHGSLCDRFGFLPVLVFASGLNANVHIFFKVFSQCILLAGPGVALGASDDAEKQRRSLLQARLQHRQHSY